MTARQIPTLAWQDAIRHQTLTHDPYIDGTTCVNDPLRDDSRRRRKLTSENLALSHVTPLLGIILIQKNLNLHNTGNVLGIDDPEDQDERKSEGHLRGR